MPKNRQMRPKSNAERQAAYRKRHLKDWDGDGLRLNMVVPVVAKLQLERLSRHYAVTQRELLVRLLEEAESTLVRTLSRADEDAYYAVTA